MLLEFLKFNFNVYFRHMLVYITRITFGRAKRPKMEDISVLHVSRSFIVVNKRHDILINIDKEEGMSELPVSVENQLKTRFPHLVNSNLVHSFHFCHRLDYSTSGVLAVALTKEAAKEAMLVFQNRLTHKYYLALLRGHLDQEYTVINKGIGKDTRENFTHCMCTEDKGYCSFPKKAVTQIIVLQRGLYANSPATKVLLKPITGRRHQLRVHCNFIGHTVVGDYTYSNRRDLAPYRMFLHAYRLVLPTKLELVDVSTCDPFSEDDPKNKWTPLETLNTLDCCVFSEFPNCDVLKI
ncbi:RNA pseudouridylate synthase domain-containing protein 1-like [Limulus polyphemus]|uniref:RNA pseudouridylate synthase domain-containing protein 1-like n=1 Tax=Limulus polyphemus TaxID=6850 RepID=A0ABM1BS87_LIMPO|nr:RNA pseudouridylate synthase domain-containing protein 1-like [Limulus polyphemus]